MSDNHIRFMELALRLGDRQAGRTGENPAVGCVIVKHQRVIGIGQTANGGRPHAEQIALAMAGDDAEGADVYVSLEPCSHQGKSPPCADALIKAKVKAVFCPFIDPNPQVSGQGFAKLEAAGIKVFAMQCADIPFGLSPFFTKILLNRPFVTIKLAMSMDGKIALQNGQSQWISSGLSRQKTRRLRGTHQAIATGVQTIIMDNPQLTSRAGVNINDPQIVVFDSNLRTPMSSTILKNRPIIFHAHNARNEHLEKSAILKSLAYDETGLSIASALEYLSSKGINSLLVEGGAKLASSFLKHNLYDLLEIVHAPIFLGDDAINAVDVFGYEAMSEIARGDFISSQIYGGDAHSIIRNHHLRIDDVLLSKNLKNL